jgi:hypothetical protein
VTDEQAQAIAEQFINSFSANNLVLDSIAAQPMEYYVQVYDSDTEALAFGFYIDRVTGAVYPEMGPDMMRSQGMLNNGSCGGGHGMWGGMGPGWQTAPTRP